MEIQECNKMVTCYKDNVQQLENEKNALEVEMLIVSLSPAHTTEKMQL